MKYIKLFESYLSDDEVDSIVIKATIAEEISEEISDINLEISEFVPNTQDYYNTNLRLRLNDSLKKLIVEQLSINDTYMDQMITLDGSVTIYKSAIKRLKRMCAYLSNKHNIELDVIYILDTYVISNKKIISILDWIFFFEFRYSKTVFSTFDGSALEDYNSLSPLLRKWNMLSDMDFLFRFMTTSSERSWVIARAFNGFFVYTTDNYKDKILVFRFDRGNTISENMTYDIDIYYDTISAANRNLPLQKLIGESGSNFTKIERITVTFDVNDKEDTTEKFFKILIDKTIEFFKIEKIKLLSEISGLLEDTNEFFRAEEINVYLESTGSPKLGVVQFVIMSKDFDDDKIFTIYVDDNLNMYINSIKEENKTSLEELLHDIYLKI